MYVYVYYTLRNNVGSEESGNLLQVYLKGMWRWGEDIVFQCHTHNVKRD